MGKSLIVTSSTHTTTANTTMYGAIGGDQSLVTTEATVRVPIRCAGVISNLSAIISANGVTGNSTVRLRKNGANANNIVTFATGVTGYQEDTVNTDTVAEADQICFMVTHGGTTGTLTIVQVSFVFTPTDNTITYSRLVQHFITSYNASVVFHDTLTGLVHNVNTTIGNVQYKPGIAGTFKNFGLYSSAGGRTVATRLPKNSTDDLVTRAILNENATGLNEDTTSSVTVNNTDTISGLHVYGGSGTTRTLNWMAVSFETTTGHFLLLSGRGDGNATNFNTTSYFTLGGRIFNHTSESHAELRARIRLNLTRLAVRVTQNSINSGNTVIVFRKNGVNGNNTVSIPAGSTGYFEDTTNQDSVQPTDDINLRIISSGTSGTITFTVVSMLAEFNPVVDATSDYKDILKQRPQQLITNSI